MCKNDPMGMEGKSGGCLFDDVWAIELVAEHRSADQIHMNPHLMQSPGDGACFDQGSLVALGKHAIGGDCGFARVRDRGFADRGVSVFAFELFEDRAFDDALGIFGRLVTQRPVVFVDLALLELFAEPVVGLCSERDEHDT